jgi:hypothetical protein
MNPHLAAALAAVVDRIAPPRIDQVWIFPPRQIGEKESGLAVLTLLPGEGEPAERRGVWTLQYEAERLKGGQTRRADALTEQATVPHDVLGRIVEGVVRRLGGDADAPDVREVGGNVQRWADLLHELAGPAVDSGNR